MINNNNKNKDTKLFKPLEIKKLKFYYKLTRPNSIPFEFILPITGSYLVNNNIQIFKEPLILLIGLLSILIGSNSMIINDYFDNRIGNDLNRTDRILNNNYLTCEDVLNISYILNIINFSLINFINNNLIKFLLSTSIILSYIYTPILKPIPLVKNILVSFIISQSIIVGGLATTGPIIYAFPATIYLFNLIMWQELILDITDIEYDKKNNINTIPVLYGHKIANKLALIFLLLGTIIPYGFSISFILIQSPLIYITYHAILSDIILNKNAINISRMIMLLSGIYMCINK